MPQVRSLQQDGIGYGLLVAIKAVSASFQHGFPSLHSKRSYIRTWTDNSVRSRDVAKLKASMMRSGQAVRYRNRNRRPAMGVIRVKTWMAVDVADCPRTHDKRRYG